MGAEQDGQIVGALCALPPVEFIRHAVEQDVGPAQAIISGVVVTKVQALAVDPAYRGRASRPLCSLRASSYTTGLITD